MYYIQLMLIPLWISCITNCNSHWTVKQKDHTARTLSSAKAGTIAKMSDMKEFAQELKPFLKVRVPGTPANLEVQQHIRARIERLGWSVEEDAFEDDTPLGRKQFRNLVATLDPSAPRRLVLACHFDSKYFSEARFIGATDSAVPCAMLLDLARSLNATLWAWQAKQKPDVSLELLFLDGEEAFEEWSATDSLYGSRHLADKLHALPHPRAQGRALTRLHAYDLFVLLDLIGYKNPSFLNFFQDTSKHFERLINIERKLSPYLHEHQKYFSEKSSYGGRIDDDHRPFMDKGVAVMHLICYPFPPVWHKPTDDQKHLEYKSIENLNAIFRVFVVEYLRISSIVANKDEL